MTAPRSGEAEVEYYDKNSPSIDVRFKAVDEATVAASSTPKVTPARARSLP